MDWSACGLVDLGQGGEVDIDVDGHVAAPASGDRNAPWTLKSDMAGEYLCRLMRHMDDNGHTVATPRDIEGCGTGDGMLDQLQSGYVQRGKDVMPRQGSKLPWQVLMHYEKDSRMLLDEPVEDGVLSFDATRVEAFA
jgi:monooxygenase